MNSKNTSSKPFSLTDYYAQLQKYQPARVSQPNLKRSQSQATAVRQILRSNQTSTSNLAQKYSQSQSRHLTKLSIARQEKAGVDRYQTDMYSNMNQSRSQIKEIQMYRPQQHMSSLTVSKVNSDKWGQPSTTFDKNTQHFSLKQQKQFIQHCNRLYGTTTDNAQILAAQINKRDEVYQLVLQQFGRADEKQLQKYFQQHALMQEIIAKFKEVSQLQEITSMSELYYFLKSDS